MGNHYDRKEKLILQLDASSLLGKNIKRQGEIIPLFGGEDDSDIVVFHSGNFPFPEKENPELFTAT